MKIMLVWPNFFSIRSENRQGMPIGLASLAGVIEKEGYEVKIIDALIMRYNFKILIKKIKDFDPDVLGISATTELIFNAYKIAHSIKKNNPNCLIVLGGPHPTICSNEIFQDCPYVDVVVRGEGEITFKELLEKKEKKKDLTDVKGITYKINGKIIENPDRSLIKNLDLLPLPAYHLLELKKYKNIKAISKFGIKGNIGCISSSRGCPYDCTFCASRALWGKKFRSNSPERVIEELRILREKHGFKIFEFSDDTFTVDKKRTEKICNLIRKEDLDICWSCWSRVELIKKELISNFRRSNCYEIAFGLESGVQKTLDFLCKGITIQDSIRSVKIVKNQDISVHGSFIIGVPGETKEMIHKTINFGKKLELNNYFFGLLTPLPGTKIYQYALENNLLLTKDWAKYNVNRPVMKMPGIKPFELKALMHFANLSCPSKY